MERPQWRRLAATLPSGTTWVTSDDNGCRALCEWDRLDHGSVRVYRCWATSWMAPTPAEPREMPLPTRSKVGATWLPS